MFTVKSKKIDLNFEYEVLRELPRDGKKLVYIPNEGTAVGRDGVIVKISPSNGDSWVGVFAFGDMLPSGECSVYEGPESNCLTVVAKGEAYIVQSGKPCSFNHVESCPVLGVIPVPTHSLILFYDYTEIAAYGENGLLWQTKRISWDGIEINSISDSEIIGSSWDAPNDKYVEFTVNLTDGTHQGGSSPPE
jgi:hypothetical protein